MKTIGLVLALLSPLAAAQDSLTTARLLPEGLGLGNQMKYSYDRDLQREIFEDWLNCDYRFSAFAVGIRLETFQPNDPNPAVSRGKDRYADIAFKYISFKLGTPTEGATVTAGNFYALFGRGMVLKSYEDRNIRVDNNLLGVKVDGRYHGFALTALSGRVESFSAQRIDILHAVDLEYKGWRHLHVGGSIASNQPDAAGAARTRIASVRLQPSFWQCEFYGEYGVKNNDDLHRELDGTTKGIVGRALYGSGMIYGGPFSFVGEYKYYDNFAFLASDLATSFNTPPSLRRDYSYVLLNRHPSPLDANNEQGYQCEANFTPDEATSFNASIGVTRTLDARSFYQRLYSGNLPVRTQTREVFAQAMHSWTDDLSSTLALGYAEELATNTRSITPIIETRYSLTPVTSLRLTIEHQQVTDRTTQARYLDDVATCEFLRSPDLSLSIVVEMQTREPSAGRTEREFWGFAQVGLAMGGHTDGTLLIGTRQAGNICAGGVCRYEPEFRGIELTFLTRL